MNPALPNIYATGSYSRSVGMQNLLITKVEMKIQNWNWLYDVPCDFWNSLCTNHYCYEHWHRIPWGQNTSRFCVNCVLFHVTIFFGWSLYHLLKVRVSQALKSFETISLLFVHIHLFWLRKTCVSVETCHFSFRVLFWFICTFIPETS